MGDIYHNSICTIACHAAEKKDKGFLNRTFDKGSVIVPGNNETAFRVILPSEFSRAVVYDSVLNWRGWVLQERLMSTRIIHFMKSQMYFESQGNNVIALDTMESNYLDTTPGLLPTRQMNNAALFNKQQGQWHRIIEWYSYCSLTLEKDKLPALAGIATMIQRKTYDDYFAGLWGRSFYEDLLWVVADSLRSKRPMSPRAPSWSWASLDGAIIYLSHKSKDGDVEYIQNTMRSTLDTSGLFIRRPDKGHLCRVSDQKIHSPPIWIDTPCSLRFVGLPRKLCRLGKRSQALSDPTQMHKNITTVVSQHHKLMKAWFRPVEMDGDVIGLVVLDFEYKEETEQQPLWYFEIGFDAYAHCVLVVSKSSHHSNLYKREVLGFICHDRMKEKGYDCNLCQDLDGSNGCQELEEFALY
jgi:hypothetical protein